MDLNPFYYLYDLCTCSDLHQNQYQWILLSKRAKQIFLSKFSQIIFMAFQLGTEKSLDGIAN